VSKAGEKQLKWHRSKACLPSECVEVATCEDHVLVRDSADTAGPVLEFTRDQWGAFVRRITPNVGTERAMPNFIGSSQVQDVQRTQMHSFTS
jgi:hypothetical protein